MAENIKRRVKAARLAVAFVAAGTIAGTGAWAQAGPPPAPTAHSSAFDSFLKIKSENVVDGSLLFKDFKKFEVPSYKQFQKLEIAQKHFEKVVFNKYYPKVEIDKSFVKHSDLDGYIKQSDADARYIKLTDSVVRGDGSVFTASAQVSSSPVRLLDVPGMFTVDATGPVITITNTSGAPLQHSSCPNSQGGNTAAGALGAGGTMSCDGSNGAAQTLQLIGAGPGGGPQVATLNFSAFTPQGQASQDTVQILIGL